MWMLNTYFFAIIFAAIRTGQLWTIIPIAAVFMLLHSWLAETEQNGTDYTTERPHSHDNDYHNRLADDKSSSLDNTTTG